jgi:hypothetical protein
MKQSIDKSVTLERPAVEKVSLVGPDVGTFLRRTIAEAQEILYIYEDDGDWYGCLKYAVGYMEEALRSAPPDGTHVPGEGADPGKIRRP